MGTVQKEQQKKNPKTPPQHSENKFTQATDKG